MESVTKAKAEIFARPEASRSQDSKKKTPQIAEDLQSNCKSWGSEPSYGDISYHE